VRYLSLFSGIEACSVAWKDWEAVAYCEFDQFPSPVLQHHYPDIPNLGDVTKITEKDVKNLGQIDLVVFGSPCQDLSVAGKRKGLDGERSGLFNDAMRIIRWAREHCGCRFALWENVPGAFSSNEGRDFAVVVGEMAGCKLGVPTGGWKNTGVAIGEDGFLEWRVLDAQWFGVPQRRRRIFALADFGEWGDRSPILLEREGLQRNSEPSRKEGEDLASNVEGGVAARMRGFGDYIEDGTVSAIKARDYKDVTDICYSVIADVTPKIGEEVCGALRANGGGGIVPPSVVYPIQDKATRHKGITGKGSGNGLGIGKAGDPAPTLTAGDKHVVAFSFDALSSNSMKSSNPYSGCREVETARCLDTTTPCPSKNQGGIGIAQKMQVRRLTPIECERLQGFPDNYTRIPFRGKPEESCPNSPRYKALGNSMAVPVMKWIGERIELQS